MMKTIVVQLGIICIFYSTGISQTAILSTGTEIELYAASRITSKNLAKGDVVNFYVRRNVIDNVSGKTIVAANTHVTGRVVNSEKARTGGRQGSVEIVVNNINSVDGKSIPVFLDLNNQGEDKRDESAEIGVLLFWPALLAKGGEAVIKIGTPIIVRTVQDVKFNVRNLQVNKKNDVNVIYDDLIKKQLAICGERPVPPKRKSHQKSDYTYKSTKEFKRYYSKLKKWEDCIPYLPKK